jgi:hypothetical protein
MYSWGRNLNPEGKNEEYSCLTAGCLAGWAGVYKPFVEQGFYFRQDAGNRYLGDIYYGKNEATRYNGFNAFAKFFELPMATTHWLTNPNYYHKTWNDRKISKAEVLDRLDYVIEHGGHPGHVPFLVEDL